MKEKLKKLLKMNEMTQNDLAELLGLTYQTISIKLNGHKDFTLSELRIIQNFFGLSAEQVFSIFFTKEEEIEI